MITTPLSQEARDRLALLLIVEPREGWEAEFEEITRREVERLFAPVEEEDRCRDE